MSHFTTFRTALRAVPLTSPWAVTPLGPETT